LLRRSLFYALNVGTALILGVAFLSLAVFAYAYQTDKRFCENSRVRAERALDECATLLTQECLISIGHIPDECVEDSSANYKHKSRENIALVLLISSSFLFLVFLTNQFLFGRGALWNRAESLPKEQ
jgi:hypothetical protein